MNKAIEIYSSIIQEKLNLFRLISLIFIAIACNEVSLINYKSTAEWFLRKNLSQIIDLVTLKNEMKLWVIIFTAAFIALSSWAFRGISRLILKKQLPMKEFITSLEYVKNNYCLDAKASVSDKIELGKYVEEHSKNSRLRIKFLYGFAEMLFTIAVFFTILHLLGWNF